MLAEIGELRALWPAIMHRGGIVTASEFAKQKVMCEAVYLVADDRAFQPSRWHARPGIDDGCGDFQLSVTGACLLTGCQAALNV
jgi:hypothetical protein